METGDEIIVTRLEHDANFTPWVLAARDAGATVRYVDIDVDDCTLDLDDFRSKFSEKTKLVAVGCASNAGRHHQPRETDLRAGRAKLVRCRSSTPCTTPRTRRSMWPIGAAIFWRAALYKFFGPHVGILYGRRELLESRQPYKLRPAPNDLPGRWMTGTQNHACIAGVLAAIKYLAAIGEQGDRRTSLLAAFQAIRAYETDLLKQLWQDY